jgi:hypothetical protein
VAERVLFLPARTVSRCARSKSHPAHHLDILPTRRYRADVQTPLCPKCHRPIPSEDINVAKDIAFCRACNVSHSFSQLVETNEIESGIDINNPPPGTWHRHDGMETVIGANHRSWAAAAGLLFVCLFWNGIVSVFVSLALAGTLHRFGIPIPAWFPAPQMNGGFMGSGMLVFLWLFLTPFITIGALFIVGFVSCLFGRTEMRVRGGDAILFVGVGGIGRRWRFQKSDVKDIRIENRQWRDSNGNSQNKTSLVIERGEGKPIKFGSLLTGDRRKFFIAAARRALLS